MLTTTHPCLRYKLHSSKSDSPFSPHTKRDQTLAVYSQRKPKRHTSGVQDGWDAKPEPHTKIEGEKLMASAAGYCFLRADA